MKSFEIVVAGFLAHLILAEIKVCVEYSQNKPRNVRFLKSQVFADPSLPAETVQIERSISSWYEKSGLAICTGNKCVFKDKALGIFGSYPISGFEIIDSPRIAIRYSPLSKELLSRDPPRQEKVPKEILNIETDSSTTNPYRVLGVSETATRSEITAAFRKLARIYHPDKNPDGYGLFQDIKSCYDVLVNPESRELYDKSKNLLLVEKEMRKKIKLD